MTRWTASRPTTSSWATGSRPSCATSCGTWRSTSTTPDVDRAVRAATSIVAALGLPVDDAVVLQHSNKVALRLLPCDVMARVAPVAHDHAALEIPLALQLTAVGAPVAALDPRVEPRGHRLDGFEVTLWIFYETVSPAPSPAAYADALHRLHAGLRTVDLPTPHASDRVAEAEQIVTRPDLSPELDDADRELLADVLGRGLPDDRSADQLLHGEPHPGNVLDTADGPRFIDLETSCRGPVEFDLAHVPEAVVARYAGVDRGLLDDCRQLVLAMVAAWRWEVGDQLPNGRAPGLALLDALRAGPPWPTLDEVTAKT